MGGRLGQRKKVSDQAADVDRQATLGKDPSPSEFRKAAKVCAEVAQTLKSGELDIETAITAGELIAGGTNPAQARKSAKAGLFKRKSGDIFSQG